MISGRKRKLTSFLEPFQQKVVNQWVPLVPSWLETYHLTLLTILFGIGVIIVGYLSRISIWWILLISPFILLQYITDILDGAVGRYRNTGLVLWGFYMDHFCDYLFAMALVAAYVIAYQLPSEFFILSALSVSGFFVHEFLMCVAKGEFNTSGYYGFGPTEIRLGVFLLNFLLPFIAKEYIVISMQGMLAFSCIVFFMLVFSSQKKLWKLDMERKRKS
jgi:phosphatidylglycerophosphate synthase